MKVVSNTRLIQRNRKLGQYLTIGALVVLGGGLYISFSAPEQLFLSFGALVVGFLLSQVGIYFGQRWGKSPRPDEHLTAALKGLDDKYSLYHYTAPVSHLLVGPAGMIALVPFSQPGTIQYDSQRKRWRQKGGNPLMKVFGQEGLGRPELEAKDAMSDMQRILSNQPGGVPYPDPRVVLVFTNPNVKLEANEAPIPAVTTEKLKDYIRRQAKEHPASIEAIKLLEKSLPSAA